ncbi:MAG: hypothetical protein AAFR46_06680, partial [Pseudomonadota bacterium]
MSQQDDSPGLDRAALRRARALRRRGAGRPLAGAGLLLAGLLGLLALALSSPVQAQSITDYGTLTLTQDDEAETDAETDAETPAAAPAAPDLEAYGRIQDLSPNAMIDTATRQVDIFQQRLRRIVDSVPDTFREIGAAMSEKSPSGDPTYFVGVAIFVLILLIIGRGAGIILAIYAGRPIMVGLQRPNPQGLIQKLPVLATRVGITVAVIVVTLLTAVAIGTPFFEDHPPTVQTGFTIMGAFFAYVLIDTTWRMIISPYLPNYRVPYISDGDAIYMYRYFSIGTMIGIFTMAVGVWLDMIEVKAEIVAFLKFVAGTVTTAFFLLLIVRNRRAITGAVLAGRSKADSSWITVAGSTLWMPAVIIYMIFVWAEQSFDLVMGLQSPTGLAAAYSVFLVSIVIYAILSFLVELVFERARARARVNAAAAAAAVAEEQRLARETMAHTASSDIAGDAADVDNDGDEEGGGGRVAPVRRAPPPEGDFSSEEVEAGPPPRIPRRGMTSFEDLAHRAASLFALGVGGFIMIRAWIGPSIFDESSIWNILQDVLDTAFFGYILYHAIRIWMDRRIAQE